MSKGVHNIAFYVSPDPECSRTTQDSEISLAPSRGRILYAIYGNSTCVINHIVVTAIDKRYRNYYVSTPTSPVRRTPTPDSPIDYEAAERRVAEYKVICSLPEDLQFPTIAPALPEPWENLCPDANSNPHQYLASP